MLQKMEIKDQARALLSDVPIESRREMVAKSRFTCESHWMMAMVMAAGWQKANDMNLHVGQLVGKAEMHRLMKLLGKARPQNDSELLLLITAAMEAFITKDYFEYEFQLLGSGKMLGIVHQCYAYTKVTGIGVDREYQCGCFGMRAGWYAALGVQVQERLQRCMKEGDGRCEILAEVISYSPK